MSNVIRVLGVDGGGSKTQALLAELDHPLSKPRTIGQGISGPSNTVVTSFDHAVSNVTEAIGQATNEAKIDLTQIDAVCLAMAGAGRDSVKKAWHQWAQQRGILKCLVVPDVHAVLAAGCKSGNGIAVISGTGSMTYGQNEAGLSARVGGWGHLISDEGSGYWITRQAFKAIVQAEDQVASKTVLTTKFLEELQVATVTELVRVINRFDRQTWASWSKLVFQAAEEDQAAEDILNRAILHLAKNIQSVAKQLNLGPEIEIGFSGGILVHNEQFRNRLTTECSHLGIQPRCTLVKVPATGAMKIAIQQLDSPTH